MKTARMGGPGCWPDTIRMAYNLPNEWSAQLELNVEAVTP
jgi:hypothetical protein